MAGHQFVAQRTVRGPISQPRHNAIPASIEYISYHLGVLEARPRFHNSEVNQARIVLLVGLQKSHLKKLSTFLYGLPYKFSGLARTI